MDYNFHPLSIEEKIKLAEELWESIETERAASYLLLQSNYWKKRYCYINKIPGKENPGKK